MEGFMKTNKTIKLISSLLIYLIIFSLTLSLSTGCQDKEVSTETGTATVTDPEAETAFYAYLFGLAIVFLDEEIKEKKALDKAIQEATEDKKAKAAAAQKSIEEELESIKAEYEAEYDFREDFLNTLLVGPDGSEALEERKKISFLIRKIIGYERAKEKQDLENQNASETTAVQAQEATQTTEKEKVKQGGIIMLDDIHLNSRYQAAWDEILFPKVDLSHLHYTGFGVVINAYPA